MAGPDALPTGTVTFLFSDIEGSTRLVERLGSQYGSLLERHNALIRTAVEAAGGVVFGTEGDATFSVFRGATAAVAAAVAAQHALHAATWPDDADVRVRMGIHTGEADVAGGTYVGMALHVTARVAAAGHGGQVLVSDATKTLVPDASVLELGTHRLKDIGEVGLHQLLDPGLEREFPPLRSLSATPNNLPASVDPFIGRSAELAEVLGALDESRLVTLTGAGGSGKTRLALEVATVALASYPDGAWFVDLRVADHGDRIVPLVAAAMRVEERADASLVDALESWLRDRTLLLVLDNCEHVVEAVSDTVARLLQRCPHVQVLATSREVLGVRGEQAIGVPPLHVAEDPASDAGSDAVALFLTRASAAAPRFDPVSADLTTVAQICRRLDGLPLAIELAAARLRALSIEQLAARLDDRFRLLSSSGRADRSHERTLEAVVAWSYDLLTPLERELFDRLAVFPSHFSLEAAEAALSDESVAEADVLDLLTRLVEKSLVTTVASGDEYRYQLLETLRQYAHDRLVDAGRLEHWMQRLLEWAMTRVEHVEVSLRRPAQDAALRSVIADAQALRAAMAWAASKGDDLAALRIASAVPIGLNGERRQLIADLLARVGSAADGAVAGHAYSALGNMAFEQGDWQASSEANDNARTHFSRAGLLRNAAWAAYLGIHSAWGAGDLAAVDALIDVTTEQFRVEADVMGLGYTLWVASLRTSDLSEADALAAEADALLRGQEVTLGVAHNVEGRGIIAYERGQLSDAARYVAEAVERFSAYGNLGCSAHALEAAAVVVNQGGLAETATELLGAAEEFRHRSGQGHRPWEIRARHGAIEEQMSPLPEDVRVRALEAGRQLSLEAAAGAALEALRAVERGSTEVATSRTPPGPDVRAPS